MILFKELTMRNFLSHGDNPNTFFLNKSPTTMVSGKNGNGKSSIMDGITFALFGRGFRDIKKGALINSINQAGTVVSITFDKGDTEYKITRGMKPNVLEIEQDGVSLHEDASVRDAQKHIESQILGFDFNTFTRVCIMSTMNYTPFMTLPAGQRRDFVENMLDLKMFSEMNKLHKAEMSQLKDSINDCSKELDIIDAKLTEKTKFAEYVKTNSDDELKVHQEVLRKNLTHIKDITESIKKYEAQLPTQLELLDEKIEARINAAAEISGIKSDISIIKSKLKDNEASAKYVTEHDDCAHCKQAITDEVTQRIVDEVSESNRGLNESLKLNEDKLKSVLDNVETLKTEEQKQQSIVNALKSEVSQLKQENALLLRQSKETGGYIETIKQKSSVNAEDIDHEIKELRVRKQEIKQVFEERTEELKVGNIILELLKDTGIKADIIKQYIPLLCAHVNSYLSQLNISLTFNMDENFNESIRTRYTNEFTYNNLSAGERSRVDLAISFAWRQVAKLKGSVHTNLLILDEVLDANLDEAGTNAALEIVNDISQDNTNIFIVSHKANLEEHVRSVLTLEKVNGFTKIK